MKSKDVVACISVCELSSARSVTLLFSVVTGCCNNYGCDTGQL